MSEEYESLPLEDFINALSSQLDRAQAALTLKAASTHLTFAVKELNLQLRTQVEAEGSVVKIRPAAPGEREASILNIAFTTVTRPMLEEHRLTMQPAEPEPEMEVEGEAPAEEEDPLKQHFSEEERRRLEWVGITNADQLRRLLPQRDPRTIERVANIPAFRLRQAMMQERRPVVRRIVRDDEPPAPRARNGDGEPRGEGPADRLRLRLEGRNLRREAVRGVRVDGESVPLVHAGDRALIVDAPQAAGNSEGRVDVDLADGGSLSFAYDPQILALGAGITVHPAYSGAKP
ncbi:hypothetical protein [Ferruginivarius sediminum]|uniref:Uncharacterized protein n=1 Tax=Ferruginivarius sediminum TaxID=2661937 RepID=A0A369TDK8_9PROT|nr:hypothetical protein [Ferruginivarius sediminum]RDD61006.1 hypothetical protein DRB17_14870 [Ferruginivarius sediminum]